eukprot:8317813-Pyramimonas_sp.AAC.1
MSGWRGRSRMGRTRAERTPSCARTAATSRPESPPSPRTGEWAGRECSATSQSHGRREHIPSVGACHRQGESIYQEWEPGGPGGAALERNPSRSGE